MSFTKEFTIDVTFLRGCTPYDGTFPLTKIANINKTQMSEGETCIIKFANIDYDVLLYDPASSSNRRGEFIIWKK